MKTRCEDHVQIAAEIAREGQARRDLERERDEHTVALISVEKRINQLEIRIALWSGAAAAIGAALPYLIRFALPAAAAAFGG